MYEIGITPPFFSREDSIKQLIKALQNSIPNLQFEERNHFLGGVYVDVLLKIYDIPFAFIEYVNLDDSEYAFDDAVNDVSSILQHLRIDIGVIADSLGRYFLYESCGALFESKGNEESRVSIESVIQRIKEKAVDYNEKPDKSKMINSLISRFSDKKYVIENIGKNEEALRIFTESCGELVCASGEVSMQNEYEVNFFKVLLGNIETQRICRYTSLSSLLSIIEEKKISMNGFASMNDPNEMHYTDYLFPWCSSIQRDINSIKKDNSIFSMSCSKDSSADDLTMWRLYGDDSRGVCIEFDIDYSKVDNNQFYIFPVYYFSIWASLYSILELFRELQKEPIETGWYFTFKKWDIWKVFFKSSHYQIENEVRLLYFSDDTPQEFHTFIDKNNGIINRRVEFPLNNDTPGKNLFPLTLKKIILGPNMPNVRKNYEQIQFLLSINDFKDVEVEISRLTNYRK